ncbi:MAG: hypothetical protein VW875_10755 [Planctomycetaceae bacterium]
MAISFKCASCGKRYEVGDELAGKKGKCSCGAVFQVPTGGASAPQQPATLNPQVRQQSVAPQQQQVPQQPAPQPSGANPLQPMTPMAPAAGQAPAPQPGLPGTGMPQQGMPGQMPMGGLPQQGMPGQMPMGGMPQQGMPGQMPMGGMPQQGMPGQMPMGGMPQQGMPGQMPIAGNAYAAPQAMGMQRPASGPVNTGIARAAGHIHFFNALVLGGIYALGLLFAVLLALIAPTNPMAGPPSGFVEFLGRIAVVFGVIFMIVTWLAPLVSITAQWMFITVPSHAGKVLGIVAGSISSVCYLLFVIFATTGDGPSPALAYLMLLALMGWWVVHHLSLWKCAAAYGDREGAKSAIISCIVFPAGGILFIILVVIIGAFADTAFSMSNPRALLSGGGAAAAKGITILILLYLLAYVCLTTFFYSKTMNAIRTCVR